MTLTEFIKKWEGKAVDFDKSYGFQCVDLVKQYWFEILGNPVPKGNGKDWINNAGTKCTKTVYKKGLIPAPGSIISWSGSLPSSGGYGHVALVISATPTSFISFDQNWASAKFCRRVEHNYSYVQGWITPKGGELEVTELNAFNTLSVTIRTHPATAAEFKDFKASKLTMNVYAQKKWLFPIYDNLKGQITTLNKQVENLQKQLAESSQGKEIAVSNIKSIILK